MVMLIMSSFRKESKYKKFWFMYPYLSINVFFFFFPFDNQNIQFFYFNYSFYSV